jgi:hypothetical protein
MNRPFPVRNRRSERHAQRLGEERVPSYRATELGAPVRGAVAFAHQSVNRALVAQIVRALRRAWQERVPGPRIGVQTISRSFSKISFSMRCPRTCSRALGNAKRYPTTRPRCSARYTRPGLMSCISARYRAMKISTGIGVKSKLRVNDFNDSACIRCNSQARSLWCLPAPGSLFANENTRQGAHIRPAPGHYKETRDSSNAGTTDFRGPNRTGEC